MLNEQDDDIKKIQSTSSAQNFFQFREKSENSMKEPTISSSLR